MSILILSTGDDLHAQHVLGYLRGRGADVELLESARFPSEIRIAYDPVHETGQVRLPGGRQLAFDQIEAVYWRVYQGVQTPKLPDAEQDSLAANDARSLFESLLIRLPARWVNSLAAFRLHQTKPVQLAIMAALGVVVPDTLVSNDREAVVDFVSRHGRCIFKPVQGGAYARRVTPDHLAGENLESLRVAPVALQEEIPGTNVRVFVAGRRVLACTIHSDEVDFRIDQKADIRRIDLPAEVEEQCRRVATALDLVWTGIDLRQTAEGRYVFLEANPSPMFIGFEQRTGLPLTESLAEVLMENRPAAGHRPGKATR